MAALCNGTHARAGFAHLLRCPSPSLGPLPCPPGCLSSVLALLSSAPSLSAGDAPLVLALPVGRAAYRIVSLSFTLLI